MRGGGAKIALLLLLGFAAACGARHNNQPVLDGGTTPATGSAAAASDTPEEAALRQQLAARDREIVQLRTQVQEAQARENDMRASLEEASRKLGGDAAALGRGATAGAAYASASTGSEERPDVVLAALRAALSQEQERRELVENQLNRLKEETSASFIGPRVPESDYLAVKQELVLLRQSLADERAAHEHATTPAANASAAADPAAQAAIAESADLRVRLKHLQEERDTIVASLNNNLMVSQRRVTELEQELTVSRAATTQAEAAAAASGLSAENAALRSQLDEERRRAQDLTAKLKLAARVNDLIFKIQAQQPEAAPARGNRQR